MSARVLPYITSYVTLQLLKSPSERKQAVGRLIILAFTLKDQITFSSREQHLRRDLKEWLDSQQWLREQINRARVHARRRLCRSLLVASKQGNHLTPDLRFCFHVLWSGHKRTQKWKRQGWHASILWIYTSRLLSMIRTRTWLTGVCVGGTMVMVLRHKWYCILPLFPSWCFQTFYTAGCKVWEWKETGISVFTSQAD